jgi:putative membrane protein
MLMGAIERLGVVPIGAVCAYRLVTIAFNTRAWQVLLPEQPGRPGFVTLFRLRWIGESVNCLLPVAQVGGDVARASLVTARGVARADSAASMMGDLVTAAVTQLLLGLAGAVALTQLLPEGAASHGPWGRLVSGLTIATLLMIALSFLFHMGALRVAARFLAGPRVRASWGKLASGLTRLDQSITALLARDRALGAAVLWHFLGWISQVGETWILLTLFHAHVTLQVAFAIETLTSAARGAAFFIPSGVGVQEMTIISLARLVGIDMEVALALGIAKRAREVVMGAPGLLAWMLDRKWWRRLKTEGS